MVDALNLLVTMVSGVPDPTEPEKTCHQITHIKLTANAAGLDLYNSFQQIHISDELENTTLCQ